MANEETPLLATQFPSLPQTPDRDVLKTFTQRLRYYIPFIGWLPKYQLKNLSSDLVAGLTVAFVIIPQGLAYALIVDVPPIYGLYTACISGIVYAFMGTCRQMSIGPEALVAIMVGSAVKEYMVWRDTVPFETFLVDPVKNIQPTALLTLMIGCFVFLMGFLRLGFIDSVLSRALLRGFVLAVAIVVQIDMSESLLGLKPGQEESPFFKLWNVLTRLGNAHLLTTLVSLGSVGFLLAIKYYKHKNKSKYVQLFPEILVVVIVTSLLTYLFRWDQQGLVILSHVKLGDTNTPVYPVPTLPKIKHFMLSAILTAIIGFVETLAVAKTYSSKFNYSISANRELVAMGTLNIVGSLFGCFPAFGSLSRSAINTAAGAKTQLSAFFTGIFVMITAIWLLPLFEYLPKAACSSIIVVAALRLIELEDLYFIIRLQAWGDLSLLLLTFLSTVFISIETGTLISVGTSLLLVVQHTTKTRIALLGQTTVLDDQGQPKIKFRNLQQDKNVERIGGVLIILFEEGLFFGNVGQLKDRLKRIELHGDLGIHPSEEPGSTTPTQPPLEVIIFEMSSVSSLDASATLTLLEIVEQYHERNITVCFVKVRSSLMAQLERSGIFQKCRHHFFAKIRDCLQYMRQQPNTPFAQKPPLDPQMLRVHLPFRPSRQDDDLVDIHSDSE
ncbi:sulfate transporter family-domain-containing protein [Gorgonomyces haynaldii]|nr:sulfate transporter family-domain-containing protein [Gorgonomyces haynaldii]